ncbi:MAG: helix-turn-helix domain-containing protein [Clostridiales bacterium]|jgi:AraC-like DNA-binding protein|nr:helix-turn-helix domain-containing protein [Clostridiales bacterium]
MKSMPKHRSARCAFTPNGAFSDMSIQQIAEQLGYSTTGSFSRAFKKIEKVTPTFCR